jgi:molybdopterin molybdotransferase
MLATMGRASVQVFRRPRVAVLSTGDELIDIETGVVPSHGKIRDSNRYMLAAMVEEAGAALHSIGHLPDDLEATIAALQEIGDPQSGADVIVTAGGVSMGDRDYVKPAVERLGSLDLWKVAIKPGQPLAVGRIGPTVIFGLPGNPISAMVTFELFVRPALRKMAGASGEDLTRKRVTATLLDEVAHTPGRREYVRAITTFRNGRYEASASDKQGSAMLQSAVAANSLLVVPEESAGLAPGMTAEVLLL